MKKKIIIAIIVVIAIFIVVLLNKTSKPTIDLVDETAIQIGEIKASIVKLNQPEYTATYPEFRPYEDERSDILNTYIFHTVTSFIDTATEPRDQSIPNSNIPYSLSIETESISSSTTESFILSEYYYTGGAKGSGKYQVFTFNETDEHISLDTLVVNEIAFKKIIKEQMAGKIFADQPGSEILQLSNVDTMSVDGMDFALTDQDLILYFDEYELGPGALGGFSTSIDRELLSEITTL